MLGDKSEFVVATNSFIIYSKNYYVAQSKVNSITKQILNIMHT